MKKMIQVRIPEGMSDAEFFSTDLLLKQLVEEGIPEETAMQMFSAIVLKHYEKEGVPAAVLEVAKSLFDKAVDETANSPASQAEEILDLMFAAMSPVAEGSFSLHTVGGFQGHKLITDTLTQSGENITSAIVDSFATGIVNGFAFSMYDKPVTALSVEEAKAILDTCKKMHLF